MHCRPEYRVLDPMKTQAGFTLIEAAITAVILMVGVIALIQIGKASASQIIDLRRTLGQPAVAERLIHDQMEAIRAPALAPDPPQGVPPVSQCSGTGGQDCVIYEAIAKRQALLDITVPGTDSLKCYSVAVQLSGKNFKAGLVDAPAVYLWR